MESPDSPPVDPVETEDSESDSPEIDEKVLKNHAISAVPIQSELSNQGLTGSDTSARVIEQKPKNPMGIHKIYLTNVIPEFNGQKLNLHNSTEIGQLNIRTI